MSDTDTRSEQKIAQYLKEAHTSEQTLVIVLQEQIAMAPGGSLRDGLESHLEETRDHAEQLERRLGELPHGTNFIEAGIGAVEALLGQAFAIGKAPLDLLRGSGGEEKVLKNAKDACATEALEIATYTALGQLARSVGDEVTAELAEDILEDEERMFQRLLKEIPRLARAVVGADVRDEPSYELTDTGAAEAIRSGGRKVERTAREATSQAKAKARKARRVPGVARAEGQIKGAVASEEDLAIAGYGKLNANEIVERLSNLSQVDLTKIDSFERKNENRATVLNRITALRGSEPWPGYDELGVEEIQSVLDEGDSSRVRRVRSYERSHKNRKGVLDATEPVNA